MAFDYKKEYKEFYMPKNKPTIVEIPRMNYIAVRGTGNPNEENGDYKNTIGLLYGIAYTIKMSYKGNHKIDGFFEYVFPPLEGFWWQDGMKETIDYNTIGDVNKLMVRSGFMHMGITATMLQSISNGKILFVGSYTCEEDALNSTIDNVKYKYYIKTEKDNGIDKEVSENEYNEYKEKLNENQYSFVTIDTELTAENIDKYLY